MTLWRPGKDANPPSEKMVAEMGKLIDDRRKPAPSSRPADGTPPRPAPSSRIRAGSNRDRWALHGEQGASAARFWSERPRAGLPTRQAPPARRSSFPSPARAAGALAG